MTRRSKIEDLTQEQYSDLVIKYGQFVSAVKLCQHWHLLDEGIGKSCS